MKVSDILRIKGGTLFTATPEELLLSALKLMADRDIGSLVVMEHGELVGMLTVRELTQSEISQLRDAPDDDGLDSGEGMLSLSDDDLDVP